MNNREIEIRDRKIEQLESVITELKIEVARLEKQSTELDDLICESSLETTTDGITSEELLKKLLEIQNECRDKYSGSLKGQWTDEAKILKIVREIIEKIRYIPVRNESWSG